DRQDALFSHEVTQREVLVASRPGGRANDVLTADRLDVFNHDVRVGGARLAVVLHIDGVYSVLGVDIANCDVIAAIAYFDRAAVVPPFESHVTNRNVAD